MTTDDFTLLLPLIEGVLASAAPGPGSCSDPTRRPKAVSVPLGAG